MTSENANESYKKWVGIVSPGYLITALGTIPARILALAISLAVYEVGSYGSPRPKIFHSSTWKLFEAVLKII